MILQLENRELTGLGGVPAQVHLPTPLTVQYEYLEGGGTAIPVMYDLAQLNPDPSLCGLVAKRAHHLLALVHARRGATHPHDAIVPPNSRRCQLRLLRLRLLPILFLIIILVKSGLPKRRPLPCAPRGAVGEHSTE